jgi:hypothetical protein
MSQTASTVMNAVFKAGCQTQMSFAFSDTLVGRPLGKMNRGRPWASHWVDTLRPDVVVINAGAHVGYGANDTDESSDSRFDTMFAEVLNDVLRYRETVPQRLILWKTQQPGGCSDHIQDGHATFGKDEPSLLYNTATKGFNYRFNHQHFRSRDEKVLEVLRSQGLPALDLRALYARSDAHVWLAAGKVADCLHLCSPGPLDMVPQVLYEALLTHLKPLS